jgi:phosphonate degradation associated HDIG domain protein
LPHEKEQLVNTAAVVDHILEIYRTRGDRHYGEDVSEREHALQCAEFAKMFGESEQVVLATLLHDYGHLLHDMGEQIADEGHDARHEDLGADYLQTYFPAEIVEPIRLHVASKRYLCGVNPEYLQGLSESSIKSLHLQGGPMSFEECRAFEQHPHFANAIKVRRYDDMGKVPGMKTADFESYRTTLELFLSSSNV